jgi:hypothetical protein
VASGQQEMMNDECGIGTTGRNLTQLGGMTPEPIFIIHHSSFIISENWPLLSKNG